MEAIQVYLVILAVGADRKRLTFKSVVVFAGRAPCGAALPIALAASRGEPWIRIQVKVIVEDCARTAVWASQKCLLA